ncbi:hypothetical protein ACH40D_42415 [Streptomyces olivaceoviridis]
MAKKRRSSGLLLVRGFGLALGQRVLPQVVPGQGYAVGVLFGELGAVPKTIRLPLRSSISVSQ